jgi:hypothetical protein
MKVYLSSSVIDLGAERQALLNTVFPQLRNDAAARLVRITEVDIRWAGALGTSDRTPNSILNCLREIDRCRPYFVSLLGHNYGYVPSVQADATELLAIALFYGVQYVAHLLGKSVHHMEVLHATNNLEAASISARRGQTQRTTGNSDHSGALSPHPPMKAFFYLRSETSEVYSEHPSFHDQTDTSIRALRSQVTRSGFAAREFCDEAELTHGVLSDLREELFQAFPIDPYLNDLAAHGSVASSKLQGFVQRKGMSEAMHEYVYGRVAHTPMVLLGPAGSGKSAVMADFARRLRADHSRDFVFEHFAGHWDANSIDVKVTLCRVLVAAVDWLRNHPVMSAHPQIRFPPDNMPQAERHSLLSLPAFVQTVATPIFDAIFGAAAAIGVKIIVLLDSVHDMADSALESELKWLPPVGPHCRVVLSCASEPSPFLRTIQAANWRTVALEPLLHSERSAIVNAHLSCYSERSDLDITTIAESVSLLDSPTSVRAAVEEFITCLPPAASKAAVRNMGHLMGSLTAVHTRTLTRLEGKYEEWLPGVGREAVRLVLRMLWVARRGLLEADVCSILSLAFPAFLTSRPLHVSNGRRRRKGAMCIDDHPVRFFCSSLVIVLEAAGVLSSAGGLLHFATVAVERFVWQRYFVILGPISIMLPSAMNNQVDQYQETLLRYAGKERRCGRHFPAWRNSFLCEMRRRLISYLSLSYKPLSATRFDASYAQTHACQVQASAAEEIAFQAWILDDVGTLAAIVRSAHGPWLLRTSAARADLARYCLLVSDHAKEASASHDWLVDAWALVLPQDVGDHTLLQWTRRAMMHFQSRLRTLWEAEASLQSLLLKETLDAARAAIAKRDAQARRREKNAKAAKRAAYAPPWNSFPSQADAVARYSAVLHYMLGAELLTEAGVQGLTEATLRKALVQFQHLPLREADIEEHIYGLLANSQHVE